MTKHSELAGVASYNPVGWRQSTDPNTSDSAYVAAGKIWIDTSTTPYSLKVRNDANSAWVAVLTLDHGTLTGLGDDDHTIYAKADGTRLRAYRNTTPASSPSAGQLWLDTNSSPAILKEYDGSTWQSVSPSSTAGHTIQDEGTPLTQRANLDFAGPGVTVTDNSGAGKTLVTIPGATGGATDLEGLSDVDLTSPATRQGLFYDGTNFVNAYDPGHNKPPVSKTANFTVTADDFTFLVNCSSGPVTATLPAVSGLSGKVYTLRKVDSTDNALTIVPSGSETINGQSSITAVRQYQQRSVSCDGTQWLVGAGARGGTTPDGGDSAPDQHDPAQTLTSTGSVNMDRDLILIDTASGNVTANLGTSVGREGKEITLKKISSDTNVVTIDPNASQTIDGSTSISTDVQYDAVTIRSDGSNWIITSPISAFYG